MIGRFFGRLAVGLAVATILNAAFLPFGYGWFISDARRHELAMQKEERLRQLRGDPPAQPQWEGVRGRYVAEAQP